MAVYTKINKKDIVSINDQFGIEKIIHFKGIKKGIENTNYLLKTKKNKFILTIFEKRVSNKEIPFFMKLMELLNNSNINCPKPLRSKNGSHLIKLKSKKACIVSFLDGKDKIKLNLKNCYEVGKVIANIHQITKKIIDIPKSDKKIVIENNKNTTDRDDFVPALSKNRSLEKLLIHIDHRLQRCPTNSFEVVLFYKCFVKAKNEFTGKVRSGSSKRFNRCAGLEWNVLFKKRVSVGHAARD